MSLEEQLADIVRRVVREELQALAPSRDADPLLSCTDAGVPRKSWIGACRSGALKAIKVGRELRARKSEVDRWLATLPSAATTKTKVESTDEVDSLDRVVAMGRERARRTRTA